jgi:hypothetical protein
MTVSPCKIVVYVDNPNTAEQAEHIKFFDTLGYTAYADAIHKYDYYYLKKNVPFKNGRFFITEREKIYMFDENLLREDMSVTPDFALIFNETEECVSEDDWAKIANFFDQHWLDENIDMTNTMKVYELIGRPEKMATTAEASDEIITEQQDYYSLNLKYLEEVDIMLYEVTKPFTDLPYTSVTRNYSKKGHLPFFTDLFICSSWGVARSDILFLQHSWNEFKMDGEFNLDVLLKNATEKCLPSESNIPEPEPEVYRRNIESTIKILNEKMSKGSKKVPEFIKNKTTPF